MVWCYWLYLSGRELEALYFFPWCSLLAPIDVHLQPFRERGKNSKKSWDIIIWFKSAFRWVFFILQIILTCRKLTRDSMSVDELGMWHYGFLITNTLLFNSSEKIEFQQKGSKYHCRYWCDFLLKHLKLHKTAVECKEKISDTSGKDVTRVKQSNVLEQMYLLKCVMTTQLSDPASKFGSFCDNLYHLITI